MVRLVILSFAGLLNLYAVISLCLFGPAWSWDYWQAWVYLGCFFGPVVLITLYLLRRDPDLLRRRVKAGPIAEERRSQKILQLFASVFFLALILVPGIDRRFHWSVIPDLLALFADAGILLGLWIVFLAFRENSYTSATIEVTPGQETVTTGPYAYVRHPMYAGVMLYVLSTPIALNSWWGLIAVPPLAIVIILRIADEERLLRETLSGFKEYCEVIRWRLVPHMW